jgi:transcriptional regulator with XRE-family HTH domain
MATQDERRADPIRQGVGMRLRAAREDKDLTQTHVATHMGVTKATVSAWETGTGDPGIYRLRELAKMYGVSADALLWENSLTNSAMQFAAEFDGLSEREKRTFKAMWLAFATQSVDDASVEERMPISRRETTRS